MGSSRLLSLPPQGGRWLAEGQTDEGAYRESITFYQRTLTRHLTVTPSPFQGEGFGADTIN